jgi:hypothetical protein
LYLQADVEMMWVDPHNLSRLFTLVSSAGVPRVSLQAAMGIKEKGKANRPCLFPF